MPALGEKLENSLNLKIEALMALIMKIIHWILPAKVFEWIEQLKEKTKLILINIFIFIIYYSKFNTRY